MPMRLVLPRNLLGEGNVIKGLLGTDMEWSLDVGRICRERTSSIKRIVIRVKNDKGRSKRLPREVTSLYSPVNDVREKTCRFGYGITCKGLKEEEGKD